MRKFAYGKRWKRLHGGPLGYLAVTKPISISHPIQGGTSTSGFFFFAKLCVRILSAGKHQPLAKTIASPAGKSKRTMAEYPTCGGLSTHVLAKSYQALAT